MTRKIIYFGVLILTIIVIYYNSMVILEAMLRLKYEVEHPIAMGIEVDIREKKDLEAIIFYCSCNYVYLLFMILGSSYLFFKNKKK